MCKAHSHTISLVAKFLQPSWLTEAILRQTQIIGGRHSTGRNKQWWERGITISLQGIGGKGVVWEWLKKILRVRRATNFSSLENRYWAWLKSWDRESHRQCHWSDEKWKEHVIGSWPSVSEEGRTIKGSHRQPQSRRNFGEY